MRELENVVERACILCLADIIEERELPIALALPLPFPLGAAAHAQDSDEPPLSLANIPLDAVERRAIEETLRDVDDNKSEAARRLGITRATLHNKLKKYGID